jgi:hypothetical protein
MRLCYHTSSESESMVTEIQRRAWSATVCNQTG